MNLMTEKKQEHFGANNDNHFGWLVPIGTTIYSEKEMKQDTSTSRKILVTSHC